jgi:ubiquinone/menaquinone biosynthesis C-methylase UbiE
VLEVAAGTGVVTRALAPRLPGDARYVATDLNPPMLDFAAGRQPPDARIVWQVADALALPFAEASFDVVVCQFGAMFFPDRVAGHAEARRVLRDGGRYVCSVWDSLADNEFADEVNVAVAGAFPGDPPRFIERTPHGYHDTTLIRDELRRAGFATVEIETRADIARSTSPREVALAFCHGTPLRAEIESRAPQRLDEVTAIVADAVARRHGEGAVSSRIQAHIVVATA